RPELRAEEGNILLADRYNLLVAGDIGIVSDGRELDRNLPRPQRLPIGQHIRYRRPHAAPRLEAVTNLLCDGHANAGGQLLRPAPGAKSENIARRLVEGRLP